LKEVKRVREGIHPEYHQAKVKCNCGNEFVTGSTDENIHVEICSKCHPFYTGTQKAVSARGRIDKFNRKYGINQENN
jgi:large subunit ribosomal protein L31